MTPYDKDRLTYEIESILISAAISKKVVTYVEIYDVFKRNNCNKPLCWQIFEEVCRNICAGEVAIYGALMADNETNLPSDGFYQVFKNKHYEKFIDLVGGDIHTLELTIEQKNIITQLERDKVYRHGMAFD